jgi:molybdopterin-containing oxidoreductase family iron-sulfur binding subunit
MRYLAGLLEAGPREWSQQDSPFADWLKSAADDLMQHKGRSLVHAGREQPVEVHVLADAVNNTLGAFGKTIRPIAPVDASSGSNRQSMLDLTEDMSADKVDTLLIFGANPIVTPAPSMAR